MQVKDLGEFGVIALLNKIVITERGGPDNSAAFDIRLLVDTGDDTAAWHTGSTTQLFTTDTVVEGVHFTRQTTPWRDLGWKSLASNISDIAAMGGLPLYALVTLGLPPETEIADLEELYRGLLAIGNQYGVSIVGGDMVRSPVVFITVALTGVQAGQSMLRSTARPGDKLAVTGYVGGSGGGLKLMQEKVKASPEAVAYLCKVHRRPVPDVAAGQILIDAGVSTAMDISDGLADDLSKLCLASGVSARIFADQIPAHPLLKEAFPEDYLTLALNGGEDYHLLFATPQPVMERVMPQLPEGAAVIGEITAGEPGKVVVVDYAGAETVAPRHGWDHFS
ncbi:MAG: thiamine-phosphate kinase [Chloroflexi bacterium]|nr:thiamine-phosphate kinase [Chloroflexota bacterium]MDA1219578.1 thiamine-phosphate kinase [Chloroflexota bacterium]PKB57545.1 MAG: thiamine-phosphate kinase [SAR202 cluster bacterium Casp-Chloro-G3]